jgi:hypothetical protein
MILNQRTQSWMEAYVKNPNTTLFIESNYDIYAATYIVDYLSKKLLGARPQYVIKPEKTAVTIDQVRNLQKSLSLQANHQQNMQSVTRIAVLEQADLLTQEAQNALLKVIEELPSSTVIFIVAPSRNDVLPTIQSRCFILPVLPLNSAEVVENSHNPDRTKKLLAQSGCMPGIYYGLDNNDQYNWLSVIEDSKKFISGDKKTKLIIAQQYSTENKINDLLRGLIITSKSALHHAKPASKVKWSGILQSCLEADKQLKDKVSSKLVLLGLSVSID